MPRFHDLDESSSSKLCRLNHTQLVLVLVLVLFSTAVMRDKAKYSVVYAI